MATANINDEDAELVTCGVCLNEYHEVTRKPKFLPCSHSTCLPCLQKIFTAGTIFCPLCRNISFHANMELVEKLPTNYFALHILKLNKRITTYKCEKCWCFTCGFKAQADCLTSKHSVLNLAKDTVKNLDSFFNLKEEFHVMKNLEKKNAIMTLENINKIEKHLDLYSKALKAAEEEILAIFQSLMGSLQQMNKLHPENEITFESFLVEVASHQNTSNFEEMVAKMKGEWNKSFETSEKRLKKLTTIASEYERRKKIRIVVKMFDENNRPVPTCPPLEDGFTLQNKNESNPLVFQNMVFLSHAVFSLIEKKHATRSVPSPCCVVNVEGGNGNEDFVCVEHNKPDSTVDIKRVSSRDLSSRNRKSSQFNSLVHNSLNDDQDDDDDEFEDDVDEIEDNEEEIEDGEGEEDEEDEIYDYEEEIEGDDNENKDDENESDNNEDEFEDNEGEIEYDDVIEYDDEIED